MLERVAAHQMSGRRVDRGVEVLEQLGHDVEARRGEPVHRSGEFRRKQPEHQRQHHAGKELHPGVEPQVVSLEPDQQADDAEQDQRPQQHPADALVDPLLDHVGERRHERDRHRQTVPEQADVVRPPVVIGRAEAGQEHAEEERAGGKIAAHAIEPHRADQDERQVRHHVPEVRDAEHACAGRQTDDTSAVAGSAARTGTGPVAKPRRGRTETSADGRG